MRAPVELMHLLTRRLCRFDFNIDGMRAILNGEIEHRELFLDAAIEASAVLMAAARSENNDFRELLQESPYGGRAFDGLIEKIEPELQKNFPRLGFAPCVFNQRGNIRQA